EAYLVLLNALAMLQAARELRPAPRARPLVVGLAGASVAVLVALVAGAFGETPRAMSDIYLQHYQMARFAGQYPLPGAVGLNDIGAVAYYTDRPILDFFGLASRETLALRGGAGFSAAAYERLAREHGVSLVMVYDTPDWLRGKIPASWRPIGTLSLDVPPTIAAERTVTLFAARPEDVAAAAAAWQAFIPTLPAGATGRAAP
ncbi:MAG TPA: hypothetical protein VGE07_04340, partial [Herpetosiphonaceae bacterium]